MSFYESIKSFFKSIPFPGSNQGSSSDPVIIYPDLNSMSAAVLALTSPQSQPSSDPHLSSLVAAGVTWLANTLPEPDLQVKKEFLRKQGGKQRDDNVIERHPLYELFDRPNPYTSASVLWKAFAYSWIIAGNVYFIKIRNSFGQVVQLWYEPHFTIRARWINDKQGEYILGNRSQSNAGVERTDDAKAFINYYEIDRDGERYRIEPADVIHFRDGIDPMHVRYGISRMTTIFREIYGDSAAANYAAQLLAGNGVIPYVLAIDDKEGALGEEDLARIKTKLLAQTTGVNAGQPLVVTARATVQRTGLDPQQLDLRTSRYMAQEVFSAVTGIPPQVLNNGAGLEKSIYNNMQQADRRAVDQYLQPLWWHIAQELTHQLLPDLDSDASHFVEFCLDEVGALQEDANEKAQRMALLYESGIVKRSWAQNELGYESDPGGADDVYYVKAGSATTTLEGEQAAQDLAMNPPAPPQLTSANGQPMDKQPLALVKGRHSGLLKGAPPTIKALYEAQ